MKAVTSTASGRAGVEWQTLALIAATYGSLGLLTWHATHLPWWMLMPLGGFLTCLHGSLQHEAVHGHPTRSHLINELLVFPSLALWFPYRRYRALHLAHHNDDTLTDPQADPESRYFDPQAWADLPQPAKWLFRFNNTVLGRLLVGPMLAVAALMRDDARLFAKGDRKVIVAWLLHAAGVAVTWVWVSLVCGMPFWQYLVLIAYPGCSLTLLRSYAEHRAHKTATCRTVIIESNPVVSLMYLNNNLHSAHHERPRLAWYDLPAYYAAHKARLANENCGYVMRGYGGLILQYLFRGKEPLAHPFPGDRT